MHRHAFRLSCAASVVTAAVLASPARVMPAPQAAQTPAPSPSPRLQTMLDASVQATYARFAPRGLREEEFAAALIDLRDPAHPESASARGDARFYPASVVKLFYLVAAEQWLEDGRLAADAELSRALRDMIVDSSNDATAYVVDVLTATSSGPPLDGAAMEGWSAQRNAVNRYFSALGFRDVNVNQKTWCEGPYGRDRVFLRNGENRNALTANATARLLADIISDRAVTAARSAEMRRLLARDWTMASSDPDDQATGFSGRALVPGARLWSKAGWTSAVRHDAAYIELPNGARFVLVTLTSNHSDEHDLIPTFARQVVERLR